jgi:hypothetical protein
MFEGWLADWDAERVACQRNLRGRSQPIHDLRCNVSQTPDCGKMLISQSVSCKTLVRTLPPTFRDVLSKDLELLRFPHALDVVALV